MIFPNKNYRREGSCINYLGCKVRGYGQLRYKKDRWYSHILSYFLNKGAIPENMHVMHLCDNPSCINPEHLVLGTHEDNMKDKVIKDRACKTPFKVREEIRKKHLSGVKGKDLALEYNLSKSTISRIVNTTLKSDKRS